MAENSEPTSPLSTRLQQLSGRLNASRVISEPRPYSRVPVLGPLLNLLRGLAHKLGTRWYVTPVLDQQRRFYQEVTAAFDELAQAAIRHEQAYARQEDRLAELNRQLDIAKGQLEARLAAPPEPGSCIIVLDYPVNSRPRYGYGCPPHPQLYEILSRNRSEYAGWLSRLLALKDDLARIPHEADEQSSPEPAWVNAFLPGLDAVALYGFVSLTQPSCYFEIGSGNSTKFVRRAIRDHGLGTKITSIDPYPRTEVDTLCDLVVRQPLEDVDVRIFDQLEPGDMLFVDHSHRVFMNSDSVVVFLDVLPRLKPGILVGFHDIFLPIDYPDEWASRYYSEQYMLACYLLAEGDQFEIVLPCSFVSNDPDLSGILAGMWEELKVETGFGGGFWIRTR